MRRDCIMDYSSIKTAAEVYRPAMAAFLRRLIALPGESCQEEARARRILEEMQSLAYDECVIDPQGNVIGVMGYGEKLIAFDGHMDTAGVGLTDGWDFDPLEGYETEEKIGGRGASDQLGGIVSAVYGAKIMKDLDLIPNGYRVMVTATVQKEDCESLGWQYLTNQSHVAPEFVISTEPTDGGICRAQQGRMEIQIDVKGIPCPGTAPDAVFKMADILQDIRSLNDNDAADEPEPCENSAAVAEESEIIEATTAVGVCETSEETPADEPTTETFCADAESTSEACEIPAEAPAEDSSPETACADAEPASEACEAPEETSANEPSKDTVCSDVEPLPEVCEVPEEAPADMPVPTPKIKGLVKMLDSRYNPESEDARFLGQGSIVVNDITSSAPARHAAADGCTILLDRRMTAGETMESCLEEIRLLPACQRYADEVTVSVRHYDHPSWTGLVYETDCCFPTWLSKESDNHVQALAVSYKELFGSSRIGAADAMEDRADRPLVDKWSMSTSGSGIQGLCGIPCVGFGPGSESQVHVPNETIWKQDLVTCAAVYAAVPMNYADIVGDLPKIEEEETLVPTPKKTGFFRRLFGRRNKKNDADSEA